ncbi:MAG: serine/threonine protein kinase, partial [bacterium]|nr:serine/threonine protein kinase [bacterium]
PAPGAAIPQRPHWKVERKLGEGGFGDMWLARHAKTREARVFKFCYDVSRLRSLQREITIFRLLKEQLGERPDVTRILDWNFEEAPYFLESEYTAAGSLVEWAEEQGGLDRVPLEVRLEIVAQVATALSAAHSVGVLHKDVKPGNVLIAAGEGGVVKAQLSDFGIGAVTDRGRLAAAGITAVGLTERTEPGSGSSLSGTRLYMAPELLEGKPPTLQTDVYGLGVVLYQMVVGDLSRALAPGWRRQVDDEVLREDIAAAVDGSPARRISNALRLAERLRALPARRAEREAERRAQQRAERGRRQRRIMAAAIVVLVLFGGAVSAMAWRVAREAQRAEREAQRAEREAEATRQVSEFLVEMFEVTDPYGTRPGESRGETITARQILDRGARRLATELGDQPEIRARLMSTLGRVYWRLGLFDLAEELIEEALALQRKTLGQEHPEVAESLHDLANVLYSKGDHDGAEALHREALAIRRRLLGEQHPDVAESLNNLADVLYSKGDYDGAEVPFREALTMRRGLLGEQHPDVAKSLNNLANVLASKGDYDAAEVLHREALAMKRRLLGEQHPDVANSLNNLASVLYSKGNYDAAEALHREALAMRRRLLGDRHPNVAVSLNNLAAALVSRGAAAEAEALIREALDIYRQTLPADHWWIPYAESNLGVSLAGLGRFTEAEPLLVRSYPIVRDRTGEHSVTTHIVLERLVTLYEAWGKAEKAAEYRALLDAAGGPL